MAGLNPMHGKFAELYVRYGNATRAAIGAGFAEKSAHVTGCRLLRNSTIQAAIADVQARMAKRLEITAERTLRELAKVAFYDPREMYDAGGRPLPVGELDDMNAAALAGIETAVKEEDGVVTVTHKYRMTDRVKALELLGRYHKLFTDKVEHGGSVTLEQLVAGSMTHEGGEAQSG